jgi:hypothetical protein
LAKLVVDEGSLVGQDFVYVCNGIEARGRTRQNPRLGTGKLRV